MSDALFRHLRQPYYPAWGDEKHQQAVRSASTFRFGVDLTDEIVNETWNRHLRTGSPSSPPQPWPDAELKVWRRFARVRDQKELLKHLELVVRATRGR